MIPHWKLQFEKIAASQKTAAPRTQAGFMQEKTQLVQFLLKNGKDLARMWRNLSNKPAPFHPTKSPNQLRRESRLDLLGDLVKRAKQKGIKEDWASRDPWDLEKLMDYAYTEVK